MIKRLNLKGYGSFISSHEILGSVTEEYYEVVEATHSKSIVYLESELIDLAVVSIFGIACLRKNKVWSDSNES